MASGDGWHRMRSRAYSAEGQYLGHAGLSMDVTERKQSEDLRQFQHTLIRAILDVSLDGILVISGENRIAAHNKRFLDVWKIPLSIPDNLPDYAVGDGLRRSCRQFWIV